jgi:hypothetical protein
MALLSEKNWSCYVARFWRSGPLLSRSRDLRGLAPGWRPSPLRPAMRGYARQVAGSPRDEQLTNDKGLCGCNFQPVGTLGVQATF